MGLNIMENFNARSYIKHINGNLNDVKGIIDKIAIKEYEFKKSLAPLESLKKQKLLEIQSLRDTKIKVNLKDILRELASLWGVKESDLDFSYTSNLDHMVSIPSSVSPDIDSLLASKKGIFYFTIVNKKGYNKDQCRNWCSFYNDIDLDAIQADGRPMREHLYFDTKRTEYDDNYEVQLKFKNLSQMINTFRLGDLISRSDNGYEIDDDLMGEAIIRANSKFVEPNTNPEDQSVM